MVHKRIFIWILSGLAVIFLLISYLLRADIEEAVVAWKKKGLPEEIQREELIIVSQTAAEIHQEINLKVPFSPQAPSANWNLPYQEACEEASALLAHYFYADLPLTSGIADEEILKIVEWEKQNLGYYQHTTALETARILNEYFGYDRVEVQYDISIDDIKTHISAGRPVILPLAGREIGNPYYRRPGPAYHMLVVKGFTKDGKFITNDVGTKRGHNYAYDEDVLFDAIHDVPAGGDEWPPEANPEKYIKTGRKAMIVVYPNTTNREAMSK